MIKETSLNSFSLFLSLSLLVLIKIKYKLMFMHSSTLIMVTTRETIILPRVFKISAVIIIIICVSTKATLSEIVPVSILENSFGFHIDASPTRRHAPQDVPDKPKIISGRSLSKNKLQISFKKHQYCIRYFNYQI